MPKQPRIGVYPGTFDPITNGHLDVIQRAATLVDRLVVAVAEHSGKSPLFSLKERTAMVADEIASLPRRLTGGIEVVGFDTLLVDFAAKRGAQCIIRGLRAVSDFEYEFQMAATNARLAPSIETMFLMASERQQFISARFVKEIARLGGDVTSLVSPRVSERVRKRFAAAKRAR